MWYNEPLPGAIICMASCNWTNICGALILFSHHARYCRVTKMKDKFSAPMIYALEKEKMSECKITVI